MKNFFKIHYIIFLFLFVFQFTNLKAEVVSPTFKSSKSLVGVVDDPSDVDFSLDGSDTFNTKLDYSRNINGFDIKFNSNYNLMSQIPDYGANIEVTRTF